MVPRAAFTSVTGRLRKQLSIPVITSNRINMPQTAEQILAETSVQLVSMARPLLADPDWVAKAAKGSDDEINTCIACNQACLDHAFVHKTVSCLLNPRAGHETTLVLGPTRRARSVAVVGASGSGKTQLAEALMAMKVTVPVVGAPAPLVMVAVNVTGLPWQRKLSGSEIKPATIRLFRSNEWLMLSTQRVLVIVSFTVYVPGT